MLPVERPFAFTSRRPNVVRSPGYYVSSSPACGVLAVPFISPCWQVARWRLQSRIAEIHWAVLVHSESWVNCEESIYNRPIACRLARTLAVYPPRTSRLAFYPYPPLPELRLNILTSYKYIRKTRMQAFKLLFLQLYKCSKTTYNCRYFYTAILQTIRK